MTATGGPWGGAGIGGYNADGGNITITSGKVTTEGGNNGTGIGGGGNNTNNGHFSTGESGNAFIIASPSIGITTDRDSWSGIIFDGNNGQVYGDQTLSEDVEIPQNKTLTIPKNVTLPIPEGITLTNNGTIQIDQGGTLENNGTLTGNGTFTGGGEITGTKLTQDAPTTGEGYAIDCVTEKITIESGYQVSSDKSSTIADQSTVAPGDSLFIRKEENNFYNASNWTDFTTPSRETTPSVSINYTDETLNTTATMQYVIGASGHGVQSWTDCNANMAATAFGNWNGSTEITVQFRTAATLTNSASEAQEVIIPARPAAPSGLQGQSTSFAGERDGEITGLAAGTAYQISSNDGTNWTDATLTGTKITGLAAGNYRVRVKAVENSTFASEASEVVKVESGPSRTYELEVTAPTFAAITYGDAQPTAQAITPTQRRSPSAWWRS